MTQPRSSDMTRETKRANEVLWAEVEAAAQRALNAGVDPRQVAWTLHEHAERTEATAKETT